MSILQLHEYRSRYINLSQSFAICEEEFKEIFQIDFLTFSVWDLNNDGLIEALEVFSGLALFSSSVLQDRLQCIFYSVLFNLFDFNFESSISRNDLQLMLYSCLNSAYKILGIAQDIPTHECISCVSHHFPTNIRISFDDFSEFCRSNDSITQVLTESELARDRIPKKFA